MLASPADAVVAAVVVMVAAGLGDVVEVAAVSAVGVVKLVVFHQATALQRSHALQFKSLRRKKHPEPHLVTARDVI